MTFSVQKKLGFLFATKDERKTALIQKMDLGTKYESLAKSEHWPVISALLNSKLDKAVQQLKQPHLSEEERIEANNRSALIDEIFLDIGNEIRRARLAKNELDKIKEN